MTRPALGASRVHLTSTPSTNDHARALATAGAAHGTVVTASVQTAGRGRQGRTWSAPPGQALLMSVVLRSFGPLLPLAAGLAVAAACGPAARIKWPNDVLADGLKVAGILAEARPAESWAVLGIGVNVALDVGALPPELHATAGTLGRAPADVPAFLDALLAALEDALALDDAALLDRYRDRDALLGRPVRWSGGAGVGAGVDGAGRLVVDLGAGRRTALDAGEVHLQR